MALTVNPALAVDGPGASELPAGVYASEQAIPNDRIELFRTADDRIFTVAREQSPRIVFKYMRAIRRGTEESGMAEMLYEVLGDAAMDVLADEKLTDDEYRAVLGAVQKYTMEVAERTLGNSSGGPRNSRGSRNK